MLDIEIFRNNIEWNQSKAVKSIMEGSIDDDVELYNEYGNIWEIFLDKGYIGLSSSIFATNPKKKPVNRWLQTSNFNRNQQISSDPVIIEN